MNWFLRVGATGFEMRPSAPKALILQIETKPHKTIIGMTYELKGGI